MEKEKNVKVEETVKDLMETKKYSLSTFKARFNEALQIEDYAKLRDLFVKLQETSFHIGSTKVFNAMDFIVNKYISSNISSLKKLNDKLSPSSPEFTNNVDKISELLIERKFYVDNYAKDNDFLKLLKNGFHDKSKETGGIHKFAMKVVGDDIHLMVGEPGKDGAYFSKIISTFNGKNAGFYDCVKALSDTKIDPLGYQSKNGRFFRFVVTDKKKSDGFKLQYNDVTKNEWITLSGAGETNVKL